MIALVLRLQARLFSPYIFTKTLLFLLEDPFPTPLLFVCFWMDCHVLPGSRNTAPCQWALTPFLPRTRPFCDLFSPAGSGSPLFFFFFCKYTVRGFPDFPFRDDLFFSLLRFIVWLFLYAPRGVVLFPPMGKLSLAQPPSPRVAFAARFVNGQDPLVGFLFWLGGVPYVFGLAFHSRFPLSQTVKRHLFFFFLDPPLSGGIVQHENFPGPGQVWKPGAPIFFFFTLGFTTVPFEPPHHITGVNFSPMVALFWSTLVFCFFFFFGANPFAPPSFFLVIWGKLFWKVVRSAAPFFWPMYATEVNAFSL